MKRGKPDIEAEIAALTGLSREELGERWRKIYGVAPSRGIRRDLMLRAVAWDVQARRLGSFSVGTRRLLRSAISKAEAAMLTRNGTTGNKYKGGSVDADICSDRDPVSCVKEAAKRQRRSLMPGDRLLREWNGKTHVVEAIEGGYVFEAKVYSSLTAIARQITGVHWSGPRFFGL